MPDDIIEKDKVADLAIAQISKLYGTGSIMRLRGHAPEVLDVIPTGSLGLDRALGVGGYPCGRLVEIFGPESSGKTTLTLHAIAEAQKLGGTAAFIDAEHSFDFNYAMNLGVNPDTLLLSQPDSGEQALEIMDILIRSNAVKVIVIDSVAALTPKAEIEGDMGDAHMGLQARLLSQALRKTTASISKSHCVVIFVNQLRMKIGVVFGNPEITTGGNALKFYTSVRLEVKRSTAIKNKEIVIGNQTRVKVVKNKVAPPFRSAEFDIVYNEGICKYSESLDLAVASDIIEKSGSYYSYKETKIGQGKENAKIWLKENTEAFANIVQEIKKRFSN